MPLQEYHRKRHFKKTAEPRGRVVRRKGFSYVIQKHAASHLHYDFRLELSGVLISWACPKGPSLDPREKRLAVQVEDHPLDYGGFEGTIPAGQYGGGTVMLWDRGSWEPHGDAEAAYRAGRLTFTLHGEKLRGDWNLVRMHGGPNRGGKANWLLIKSRDEEARPLEQGDITEEQPLSVKTGRDLPEIAEGTKVWHSNRSNKKGTATKKVSAKKTTAVAKKKTVAAKTTRGRTTKRTRKSRPKADVDDLPGARRGIFPEHPESQLATLVDKPPAGDAWLHEIKFDGYRMFCSIDGDRVSFVSRNGQDWTSRLPSLVETAKDFPVEQAVLDGEVVALDEEGVSRFQLLQNAFGRDRKPVALHYYVFDLLYWDGLDLARVPLEERKHALEKLVAAAGEERFRYSEHFIGIGDKLLAEACRTHLEGIISKRRDAPYSPGRSGDWLKIKCKHEQEFVIGGYSDPGGSRTDFGSLLVGYYDRGKLTYAGRVGTGFTQRTLRDLAPQLRSLSQTENPFEQNAGVARSRDVHWVRPKLVAQVEFANWTEDGLLRQPSFQGLRDDKSPQEVRREKAQPGPNGHRKNSKRKATS